MDRIYDFSNCKRAHASFGGTERKFGVVYDGETYMLKFSENHAKKHDISTSYVNNVISEYISSHIAQTMELPVHTTILGTYNDQIVVGCKDFRENSNVANVEFSEYVRARYDSNEIKRIIRLDQIYDTLKDPSNDIPKELQEASIRRYWDTFVVDALVGNFDRHIGNWGYLAEDNSLKLAPIYDFGSTLFPQMSDEGAKLYLNNEFEIMKRCLVFPSPSLVITSEKVGKVGYYDMMASNYDANCSAAVLRMVPKIDMNVIKNVIAETPLITDVRKEFYVKMLEERKTLILDRAYIRCVYKEYDQEALDRLNSGRQFDDNALREYMIRRDAAYPSFSENEQKLDYYHSADYIKQTIFDKTPTRSETDSLLVKQRGFAEEYGFYSQYVWQKARSKHKSLEAKHQDFIR